MIYLHIQCASAEVDAIVGVCKSSISVRNMHRLRHLVQKSISFKTKKFAGSGVVNSTRTLKMTEKDMFLEKSESENKTQEMTDSRSRMVVGKRKSTNRVDEAISKTEYCSSPFSDAFLYQPLSYNLNTEIALNRHSKRKIESFLNESNNNIVKNYDSNEPNLEWTKQRMDTHQINKSNTLEKRIDVLGLETTCKVTKSMIASSRVVNQVDNKFIVFVANDTICLLDQHAGDERVRFERHQVDLAKLMSSMDALTQITSQCSPSKFSHTSFSMCKLKQVEYVHTTLSLFQVAKNYQKLLSKWHFNIVLRERTNNIVNFEIEVTSVPTICGKNASPKKDLIDFLQYLKEQTITCELGIKPPFVRRILASQACRNAIMFGDRLSLEECRILLKELSKCQSSFVCAHGRPSVIPLINLKEFELRLHKQAKSQMKHFL